MRTILVRKAQAASDAELQWFSRDRHDRADSISGHGSYEALRDACADDQSGGSIQLIWLVDGTRVVLRRISFDPAERRHLNRLLPYQLEQDLATDLDTVHFALGVPAASTVSVAVVDHAELATDIEALEAVGLTVQQAVHEAQLLPGSDQHWTLLLEASSRVHVRFGEDLALSIHADMLAEALTRLFVDSSEVPQLITLQAADAAGLEWLQSQVQACYPKDRALPALEQISGDYAQAASLSASWLDLRQGRLLLAIPYAQTWQRWRGAALAVATALLIYIGGNLLQWWVVEQRRVAVEAQIVAEYRSVVPQGVLVNPVAQLRNRLTGSSAGGAGVLSLMSRVVPALAQAERVQLQRLQFNGQSGQLQLSLEAAANAEILALTEQLSAAGVRAQPANLTAVGDRQRAVLMIGGEAL
ncbi:MAG: type II secretion system protein GspL [Pseudohongiellaceae bacterium]